MSPPEHGAPAVRSRLRSTLLALALIGGGLAVVLGALDPADAQTPPTTVVGPEASSGEREQVQPGPSSVPADQLLRDGRQLYLTGCVSCHGPEGQGTADGPSLKGSGEGITDFNLRTGRMPLAAPVPQPPSKPVPFDDAQIESLVAYVGSLCDTSVNDCPPIPDIDPDAGTIEEGSELYLANCAACHGSVGTGGALSYGRHAPSLQQTPPQQVGEAIRTGPGQMPRFGPEVLSDHQVNSIVNYVRYLQQPDDPGGFPLGYTGPVAEGFVALLLGLGVLVLAIRWITSEPDPGPRDLDPPAGGPDPRDGAATLETSDA